MTGPRGVHTRRFDPWYPAGLSDVGVSLGPLTFVTDKRGLRPSGALRRSPRHLEHRHIPGTRCNGHQFVLMNMCLQRGLAVGAMTHGLDLSCQAESFPGLCFRCVINETGEDSGRPNSRWVARLGSVLMC